MKNSSEYSEPVQATVELTGEYETIATIIGKQDREYDELRTVTDDMEAVLEVVAQTGGTTKSGIVEKLPADVTAELDTETVIYVLRVLELYELVTLDGNTWRPGGALSAN